MGVQSVKKPVTILINKGSLFLTHLLEETQLDNWLLQVDVETDVKLFV